MDVYIFTQHITPSLNGLLDTLEQTFMKSKRNEEEHKLTGG